jgi:hypothetical protein
LIGIWDHQNQDLQEEVELAVLLKLLRLPRDISEKMFLFFPFVIFVAESKQNG